MGCDGGTIPKRHELVKGPKKVEKNKDAVIEFLLDKSAEKALGKAASHIKSMKYGAAFQEDDVIVLSGTKEDVETLRTTTRVEVRRLRAKQEKKLRKPKADSSEALPGPSEAKSGKPGEAGSKPQEKRGAAGPRSAANGASSGKAGKPGGPPKRSIADSEESETYKSLFTHSSAKRSKEESAHLVTHTSYCF